MSKKSILLMAISMVLLVGCGAGNKTENPNATEAPGAYPIQTQEVVSNNNNAYPIVTPTQAEANAAYPGPETGTTAMEMYPQNFVDQLQVPTPSNGKGVITGQLLIGGDATKPFITILYLSAATPNSDPNKAPKVHFVMDSDPMATQEISSGKFYFSDIAPGQYALVIWSPSDSSLVENSAGNILIIEAKANKVTELGIIPVKQ